MRIKFVSKTPVERMAPLWEALVPTEGMDPETFIFDPDARDYDFLCVYEDLPPLPGERKIMRSEQLACPRAHTLLITTEPSSIRIAGPQYLAQFGTVWTSVPYPDDVWPVATRNYSIEAGAPPLRLFYGRDMEGDDHLPLNTLAAPIAEKSSGLSTVTSKKAMDHTVHAERLNFVSALKDRLGDALTLFGRGFHPVRDKREAMTSFRYHLAIENHIQSGHHTEKLTDCFIAECLPFYFGDPDYDRAYPRDAVIPIDIFDLDAAEATIREAIMDNACAERLPEIRRAKALALERYNPVLCALRWASELMSDSTRQADIDACCSVERNAGGMIHGRHAFRRAHPVHALQDAAYSARARHSPMADPLQGYKPFA